METRVACRLFLSRWEAWVVNEASWPYRVVGVECRRALMKAAKPLKALEVLEEPWKALGGRSGRLGTLSFLKSPFIGPKSRKNAWQARPGNCQNNIAPMLRLYSPYIINA